MYDTRNGTYFLYSLSSKCCNLSLIRYDVPFILITWEWCNKRSNMALANTLSLNTSPHLLNVWFVVIIVECFSYLFAINWKNKFAPCLSTGKYPISSIINNSYLQKCLILDSNLFSKCALFNCVIRSWQLIKYTEYLFFAAVIPMEVAKWCLTDTTWTYKQYVFMFS